LKTTKYIIGLLAVILIISCQGEPTEPVLAEEIKGQWKIIEAFRNNKETPLLNKGFFVITDSTFMTNISAGQSSRYTYNSNVIQLLDEKKTKYNVMRIEADTLYMNAKINNLGFKFKTVRQVLN